MRQSIKEPISALYQAWDRLAEAADAHLRGDSEKAESFFRAADCTEVWHWVNPASGPSPRALRLNVRNFAPENDTQRIPKDRRAADRQPSRQVKTAVLARDGYRCRYCGIPVISAEIRKIARTLYPQAIRWVDNNEREQHAAFQCFWLQYDHVTPHSHGGSSTEENIVVSCHLCNFGKDQYTIKQLDIADPRERPPEPAAYDGLERLRTSSHPVAAREVPIKPATLGGMRTPRSSSGSAQQRTYFLTGAWISQGYLYTPRIQGKERWFKLSMKVHAEPATIDGEIGCLLTCDDSELIRRNLSILPISSLINRKT